MLPTQVAKSSFIDAWQKSFHFGGEKESQYVHVNGLEFYARAIEHFPALTGSFYLVSLSQQINTGSGCGADGRPVTYDARDPWFESSHQQFYLL